MCQSINAFAKNQARIVNRQKLPINTTSSMAYYGAMKINSCRIMREWFAPVTPSAWLRPHARHLMKLMPLYYLPSRSLSFRNLSRADGNEKWRAWPLSGELEMINGAFKLLAVLSLRQLASVQVLWRFSRLMGDRFGVGSRKERRSTNSTIISAINIPRS